MADRLGIDNKQQQLIGNAQPVRKAPQPSRRPSPAGDEVIVVNASEKRYLWTARAFAVIVAISLCCNLVLILAIAQILPIYRIEPFLLTFENKEEQVYDIQPLKNMQDRKAITEVFVREYVLLRSSLTSDIPEMESRWMPGGPIQEMSSSAVYQAFVDKTAKRGLEAIKQGLTRQIHIMTINEISGGRWQVEYESFDMTPDSAAPEVAYWTATLRVGYRKKNVKYGERLNNPVGFTVVQYNLQRNKAE